MKKIGYVAIAIAAIGILLTSGGVEAASREKELEKIGFQESGMPIVSEPITLKIFSSKHNRSRVDDYNTVEKVQEYEAKTNVHIDWNIPGGGESLQKLNLLLASGDLPDVILHVGLDPVNQLRFSQDGILIPLQDLMKEHAPHFSEMYEMYPSVLAGSMSPDGNLYALSGPPYWSIFQYGMADSRAFINTAWLDKLGLDMPTTTEEFAAVLRAFKDGDPNGNGKADEIPLSFIASNPNNLGRSYSLLLGAFGSVDNAEHLMLKDDTVIFTANMPEYKKGIEWLHSLYQEGLIDMDSFTQDHARFNSKARAEEVVMGVGFGLSGYAEVGPARWFAEYAAMPPLQGPDGHQLWLGRSRLVSYAAAITSACKYPEVAMRWIDHTFGDQETIAELTFAGFLKRNEEGRWENDVEMEKAAGMMIDEARHNLGLGSVIGEYMGPVLWPRVNPEQVEVMLLQEEMYAPYISKPVPGMFMSAEHTDTLNAIGSDLRSYVHQKAAEWISNGKIDEEWDTYLKQLERLQVDEYVQIYNDEYALFLEKMGQ